MITGIPYVPSWTTSAALNPVSGSPTFTSPVIFVNVAPALPGSTSCARNGSGVYVTFTARTASRACSSVSAAIAAISCPAHITSAPGSKINTTPRTPGIFSATLVSIASIFACACSESTIFPYSIPGRLMSKEYFALPDDFHGPSMREIRLPIRLRLSAGGQ